VRGGFGIWLVCGDVRMWGCGDGVGVDDRVRLDDREGEYIARCV